MLVLDCKAGRVRYEYTGVIDLFITAYGWVCVKLQALIHPVTQKDMNMKVYRYLWFFAQKYTDGINMTDEDRKTITHKITLKMTLDTENGRYSKSRIDKYADKLLATYRDSNTCERK